MSTKKGFAAARAALPSFGGARPQRSLGRGSVPAIIYEAPRIPAVPLKTPIGMAVALVGAVLAGEGLASLFISPDQSAFATAFRIFRITAGGAMLVWVAASSK